MKKSENDAIIRQLAQEYEYSIGNEQILDYYYDLPIEDKTILIVGLGNALRGSMFYVVEALQQEKFKNYKVYFFVKKDTKKIVDKIIERNHFYNTKAVVDMREYNRLLCTAKYLITEIKFQAKWIKKEGQVYINIWHGTPLKCLGLDKNTKSIHKDGRTQRNFIDADYLLYPNDYTREHMLDAYRIRNLTHAKALMCGYPRSSILLDKQKSKKSHERLIHKRLAPDKKQVFAYMPTWRDNKKVEDLIEEMQYMLNSIDKNLKKDQVLYVNLHHKIDGNLDYSNFENIKKFPADMDNYEVLAGTDVLLTDYSSVFFDFLVTRRKVVLYCPDIDEYFKTRGTYTELKEMSFAKAYNMAELIKELNTPKDYDDEKDFQKYCNYDSINNAKNLCKIFADDEKDLTLLPVKGNGNPSIVIYSERLQQSKSTDLLREYTKIYDKNKWNLYISCLDEKVDPHKKSAYPMLEEIPVIGIHEGLLLTAAQTTAYKMYLENVIDFDKYIELVEESYALENRRVYGCARFDTSILYESDDPYRILAYAQMPGRKIFFIQDSMIKAIEDGNLFLKEACAYMMKKCDVACAISGGTIKKVQSIWNEEIANAIVLIDKANKLKELIG